MGISKDQSFFDPASPTSGDIGGSYLLGADGTVIGNTSDALKVEMVNDIDVDVRDLVFATDKVDASGSEVSLDAATLAALETTTVTATDLDIRNLLFATDKVDASGSEVSLDAATLAALETTTVVATDLDIRNLLFATDKVDVSGSSITTSPEVHDAINNEVQTITTTASQLIASPLAGRTSILIQNNGVQAMYIGQDNTVTSANGVVIPTGGSAEFPWGPAIIPWALTSAATTDARMLETK